MILRILFILTLCFATSAFAEDPLMEKARKGFNLAMSDATLGEMGATVGQNVVDGINQRLRAKDEALSGEQEKAIIDRFTVEFFLLIKDVEDDVVQIYVDVLTERELDLMIEMYSNPEMAAMMTKMPQILGALNPIIQEKVPPMALRVMGDLQREGVLSNL